MNRSAAIASIVVLIPSVAAAAEEMVDWVQATAAAPWQARDSQGELVYDNRLWIFGGWLNSYEAPPRDVWSSTDGQKWNRVDKSAPWIHSDLSMSLTFRSKMWFMGGWYNGRLPGHSASNNVWSSTDGIQWEQTPASARWSPRLAAGIVEFQGKMWILGGTENYYFGDSGSLKNDVWSSPDGENWTLMTDNADWAPRAYHAAVAFDNKLWVFGGGNYVPEYQAYNDVWYSEDGIRWTQATESAAWAPRLWFSSVVYRNRMWVLGGWSNNPSTNLGDVWYSQDGNQWTQLHSNTIWKARHEHSALVFQDKIWIAGGHARPLSSEVWSLDIPKNWFHQE